MNPIVVRFDDPFLVSIAKPKQASLTDRVPEQGSTFGSRSGDTNTPDSLLTRCGLSRETGIAVGCLHVFGISAGNHAVGLFGVQCQTDATFELF